jgi:flagellar export protein FliJ
MSSYRFRLQSLLDLRRRQTEAEEAKLAEMTQLRVALENRRQQLRRTDSEARASIAGAASHHAADLQTVARYASHVIEACALLARQINEQSVKIEAQRKVVYERRRNEELLEKLKQEGLEDWQRAIDLELESLGSDSYMASWNRRKMAGRREPAGS